MLSRPSYETLRFSRGSRRERGAELSVQSTAPQSFRQAVWSRTFSATAQNGPNHRSIQGRISWFRGNRWAGMKQLEGLQLKERKRRWRWDCWADGKKQFLISTPPTPPLPLFNCLPAFHSLQRAIHILMHVFLRTLMNPCALIRHEYFIQAPWLRRRGGQGMREQDETVERGRGGGP